MSLVCAEIIASIYADFKWEREGEREKHIDHMKFYVVETDSNYSKVMSTVCTEIKASIIDF